MLNFNQLSYWEQKAYLNEVDFCIIGSGIVGLTTAIYIKKSNPKANVLILERGYLPTGASTKNAGFVCYGSPTEILGDLDQTDLETIKKTIALRYRGFQLLKELLGSTAMAYREFGAYELFKEDDENYQNCIHQLETLNDLFYEVTERKNAFKVFDLKLLNHQFKSFTSAISCELEGELDTSKMMTALVHLALSDGIRILNSIEVTEVNDDSVNTNYGEIKFKRCVVATNAFTNDLVSDKYVEPARAQVLITSPIPDLKLKGTFHFDRGYYYFRMIDQRILFGGGRNMDFTGERTVSMENSNLILNHLKELLKTKILPDHHFEIEQHWAGIMGVGKNKFPHLEFISNKVFLASKLGGMGVAMGAFVGKSAAHHITNS